MYRKPSPDGFPDRTWKEDLPDLASLPFEYEIVPQWVPEFIPQKRFKILLTSLIRLI